MFAGGYAPEGLSDGFAQRPSNFGRRSRRSGQLLLGRPRLGIALVGDGRRLVLASLGDEGLPQRVRSRS